MYVLDCDNLIAYGPFVGRKWCITTNAHFMNELTGEPELDIVVSDGEGKDYAVIITRSFYVIDDITTVERETQYKAFKFLDNSKPLDNRHNRILENMMNDMFGDHVEITVSKEGITVDDYDYD